MSQDIRLIQFVDPTKWFCRALEYAAVSPFKGALLVILKMYVIQKKKTFYDEVPSFLIVVCQI